MLNMESVVQIHNTNFLFRHTTLMQMLSKSECLLNNECSSENVTYKAAVSQTPSQISKCCYRTCERTFATFGNKSKQKSTKLSKHIWD